MPIQSINLLKKNICLFFQFLFSMQYTKNSLLSKLSFLLLIITTFFVLQQLEILNTEPFPLPLKIYYGIFLLMGIFFWMIEFFFRTKEKSITSRLLLLKRGLLLCFPAEIILLWGTQTNEYAFHYIFHMAVSFYIFFLALYVLSQICTTYPKTILTKKSSLLPKTKKGIITSLYVIVIAVSFFSFGSYGLKDQSIVDEPLWLYERVPRFWSNLSERDWDGTRISDKPGITVALLSGIGLLEGNPKEHRLERERSNSQQQRDLILNISHKMRLPILLFASLSLFMFYILIQQLWGRSTALITTTLIGLSPILLGISRIINPDALLWIFSSLTLLSYFNFQKNKRLSFLVLTGILLGLALLTKYVANIIIIFFFGIIFLEYLFSKTDHTFSQHIKNSLKHFCLIILISLITFFILFPATWIDITLLLRSTLASQAFENISQLFVLIILILLAEISFNKGRFIDPLFAFLKKKRIWIQYSITAIFLFGIVFTFVNTLLDMHWYNIEKILASPKSSYKNASFFELLFSGFYPLVFGVSPLVLFFMIISSIQFLRKKALHKQHLRWSLYSILFILLYYIATTFNHVAAPVRYQIILYPLAFLLAAIGISSVLSYFKDRLSSSQQNFVLFGTLLILIGIHLGALYQVKPFYFSYASSILPMERVLNLKDMGDGSYQAAQYLNKLSNAQDMTIWSDKRGVCTFFSGTCYASLDHKEFIENNISFAYYVVSSGRKAKTSGHARFSMSPPPTYLMRFDHLYDAYPSIHEIHLGNRESNYIKIIDAKEADILCHECLLH